MTILIYACTPEELLLCSDLFRYNHKKGVLEAFWEGTFKFDHTNFKDNLKSAETNAPKIFQITKNTALMRGGDTRLNHAVENLNAEQDIPKQIIDRLRHTNIEPPSIWGCYVGSFYKDGCAIQSIGSKNGEVTYQRVDVGVIIDTFSQEIIDIFHRKYVTDFWFLGINAKIKILNSFFEEITKLYDGLAGGTPQICQINKEGFKWLQH